MKLFSKIATLALGAAMAVGVGVAVGSGKVKEARATSDTATYNLVTSTDQLEVGKNYVITNGKANGSVNAMSTEEQQKYRRYTSVTVSNNSFVANANVLRLTLSGSTDAWVFTTDNYAGTNGVLYPASGDSNNELYVGTSSSTATISFASGDAAVITLSGGARGIIRWNNSSGQYRFSCYKTGQQAVYLWKEAAAPTTTYTVSFNGNGGTGSMDQVPGVAGSYTLPANGFTAPSGKAFIGWKAGNTGDLIAAGDSYSVSADVSFFAQWATAYTVTYTSGTNGSGSYAHASQPAGTYTLLPFTSLSGVSANTGYAFKNYTVGGVAKAPGDTISLSDATAVTVNFDVKPDDTTYVFATNFSTYASAWSTTYGTKTINGKTDVGGAYDATIKLTRVNKQSSGVGSDKPYVCPNTASDEENLVFTLNESGKKINDVTVTYETRGTNAPVFKLFKGNDVSSGTVRDTATIGTKNTLSTTDLNDVSFSISGNAGKSGNVGAGLVSIYISVVNQAAYGTTDHIKVTKFPNLIYHVGEVFDKSGLEVTAYDGSNEDTANFKDITDEVEMGYTSGVYTFDEDNVPTSSMWLGYVENDQHYYADDIVFSVYSVAEYELVTEEPSDWSGQYLFVASDTVDEETVYYAMNGSLENPDVEGDYKFVSPSDDVIQAGQELEWTIAPMSGGYSIQGKSGKYIGSLTADSNGLLVSSNPVLNTISISGSDVSLTGTNGRSLKFNNAGDGRFRYYASGSVKVYKLKVSDNADAYAQTFLGAFTCDSTGENAPTFVIKESPTYWSWALLKSEYNKLTPSEKEQFHLGVASQTGTNIQKALARYDYVVGKYGTDVFEDYMERNPDPIPSAAYLANYQSNIDSSSSITIIVIVAVTSMTLLGVTLVLRKRKHQ